MSCKSTTLPGAVIPILRTLFYYQDFLLQPLIFRFAMGKEKRKSQKTCQLQNINHKLSGIKALRYYKERFILFQFTVFKKLQHPIKC
jgi:hypothetical protein